MSWQDFETLRIDCLNALKQAGHRCKKRFYTSSRKQRTDRPLVQWQKLEEKSAKQLGYANYTEWAEQTGHPPHDD